MVVSAGAIRPCRPWQVAIFQSQTDKHTKKSYIQRKAETKNNQNPKSHSERDLLSNN